MLQLNDYKFWIDFLAAVLSPVIAITLGYLTFHQYKLEKQKHRLELYDRRFAVFEEVNKFLSEIFRNGKTDFFKLSNLLHQTNQSKFLFDDEISQYIDSLYMRGIDFVMIDEQLNGHDKLEVGPERTELAHTNSEHLKFFVDQFNVSQKVFMKYLKIDLY